MRAPTAALLFVALALAGCGGSESASHVAELGSYDEKQPLRTRIEAENSGSTDITFQSPRGGDVEATVVLPRDAGNGKRYPAAVYLHPYRFSRAFTTARRSTWRSEVSPCCSSTPP